MYFTSISPPTQKNLYPCLITNNPLNNLLYSLTLTLNSVRSVTIINLAHDVSKRVLFFKGYKALAWQINRIIRKLYSIFNFGFTEMKSGKKFYSLLFSPPLPSEDHTDVWATLVGIVWCYSNITRVQAAETIYDADNNFQNRDQNSSNTMAMRGATCACTPGPMPPWQLGHFRKERQNTSPLKRE